MLKVWPLKNAIPDKDILIEASEIILIEASEIILIEASEIIFIEFHFSETKMGPWAGTG